jgi:ADP-heptose:LPS heptosyltransferase
MRILIWRTGAFGDCIVTTPLVRHLAQQGNEIYYVAGDRGEEVLKNNPHITKILKHDDTVKNELLGEHIEWLKKKNRCDRVIDLNESIECALSQHPRSPNYKLPKKDRIARFNRNFYEYCFEHAGEIWDGVDLKPELFFDEKELEEAGKYIKKGNYNLLVGLSGSGNNKAYPWMMDLCNSIQKDYPTVHIITVGDLKCQILEDSIDNSNITKLSGNIPMRHSMALTGLVDCVISPDTGLLHAAGCYSVPKIGLIGHNTLECITKHFTNDHSLEADPTLAPCAPCLFMIYDMKQQCPLSPTTGSSVCMSEGLPLQKAYDRFQEVYDARL